MVEITILHVYNIYTGNEVTTKLFTSQDEAISWYGKNFNTAVEFDYTLEKVKG